MRICVDQNGVRQDKELLGDEVHEVNKLAVIANESYADFITALQQETYEVLRNRMMTATKSYFKDRLVIDAVTGERRKISDFEASAIMLYLEGNDYVDNNGKLTATYYEAEAEHELAELPKNLEPIADDVNKLILSIFDPKVLEGMVEEDPIVTSDNELNDNFNDQRFQKMWNEINHKYVYTVHYNSEELIAKAIASLQCNFSVTKLQYVMASGEQAKGNVNEFGLLMT